MIGSKGFRNRERALAAAARSDRAVRVGQVAPSSRWELATASAQERESGVLERMIKLPLIEDVLLGCEEMGERLRTEQVGKVTEILFTPTTAYREVKKAIKARARGATSDIQQKTAIPLPVNSAEENEASRWRQAPSKYVVGLEEDGDGRKRGRIFRREVFEFPWSHGADYLYVPLDSYRLSIAALSEIQTAMKDWSRREQPASLPQKVELR